MTKHILPGNFFARSQRENPIGAITTRSAP
jgi:hypothetical protein